MSELGLISYTFSAALFSLLSLVILFQWRGALDRLLLLLASSISIAWAGFAAYLAGQVTTITPSLQTLEIFRDLAWLAFLFHLVNSIYRTENKTFIKARRLLVAGISGVCVLLLIMAGFSIMGDSPLPLLLNYYLPNTGHALLGLAGVALVEQLLQHTRYEQRNAIKFLCLGIGSMFAYDFIFYVRYQHFRTE